MFEIFHVKDYYKNHVLKMLKRKINMMKDQAKGFLQNKLQNIPQKIKEEKTRKKNKTAGKVDLQVVTSSHRSFEGVIGHNT